MSALEEGEIAADEIEAVAAVKSSRFKPDVVSDEEPIPDFTLQDMADFLVLRQKVWYDKEILHKDNPLTDDPVLREWRICNIFREQDAGTRYMLGLLDRLDEMQASHEDKLLNIMIYRLINRAEVWEEYAGTDIFSVVDVEALFDKLEAASDEGVKVGSNTWRATSLDNLRDQALSLADGLDEIYAICTSAKELRTVHAVLSRGYGIGEFVAYQIAVDLKLVFPHLKNDDWVHVGGRGARGKGGHGGSMWALRRLADSPSEDVLDVAMRLRDTQDVWVPRELYDYQPPRDRLTIEDVDNLACEFRKYWFKRHGQGSLRRYGPEPVKVRREPGQRRSSGRGTRASESSNWETPPELFKQLHEEFSFTVDAAATVENALLGRFWTPEIDALRQPWAGERVYAFPPMHELSSWTAKAKHESERSISVILAPAYTETRWFNENVAHGASEIRFVRGMMQFWENKEPRPTVFQNALMVLVYKPGIHVPSVDLEYTYPGRKPVDKAGWTGWD